MSLQSCIADLITAIGADIKARITDAPVNGKSYARKDGAWADAGVVSKSTVPYPNSRATTIESCDSAWDDYYVGGEGAVDTTIFVRGTASQRITAAGAGTYGTVRDYGAVVVDISGHHLKLNVRCSNWASVSALTLILASDGYGLSNTYTIDIGTRLINPPSNEWIELVVPFSGLIVDGAPDPSSINLLLSKLVATAPVQVWFDDIATVPGGGTGLVSITFDDGYDDVSNVAKPILDKHGFAATAYIAPSMLGETNFLTEIQVRSLAYSGWDIGGHGMQNLTELSPSELEAELSGTHAWLANRGLRGAEHYAFPNGAYNDDVLTVLRRYFSTATNIDGFNNPVDYVSPYRINRQGVDRYTTPAMIAGWVDDAIANGEWCILNFHTLVSTLVDGQDYLTSDFETVMNNLTATGVEVLPVSEALRLMAATTALVRARLGPPIPSPQ